MNQILITCLDKYKTVKDDTCFEKNKKVYYLCIN